MDSVFHFLHASSDPREAEQLRQRIQLYLLVMLAIDLVAYVSDYVTPLLVEGLTMPDYPLLTRVVRYASTAMLAAVWSVAHWTRPPTRVLIVFESTVTLGLTLVYIHIAGTHMTADEAPFAPVFAMFGIMLLLSVRASLVPSSRLRTAAVGTITVGFLFAQPEPINGLAPRVLDGLGFIGAAFIIITTVTSHVIYGLRRQVRQALQLGQYTIEEKLGEGGMGAVYRARHAMLRRQAAIKLISPQIAGDPSERAQALQRFEREADVTASLRSPHTVELYDFGMSEDGALYYVMELLDGINLQTAVQKYGAMPPDRVVFLLRQVCESLAEAHAAGLVHRDIKPANILMCRYGLRYDFVKVLDFGLVGLDPRHERHPDGITAEGVVRGTPAYLAPEIATGAQPVDGRTDLYGVGCVAYWLLTGRVPFERDTAVAAVLAHVTDRPTPPSRIVTSVIPPALEAVVLACLEKQPANRPQSAGELSRRLQGALGPGGWNHDAAERWWLTHRPRPAAPEADATREVGLTLTKAWVGLEAPASGRRHESRTALPRRSLAAPRPGHRRR